MLDLIIKNGQSYIDGELKNVAIKDGKIEQIGQISDKAIETKMQKNTVLPGCIDTQTHFREPGSRIQRIFIQEKRAIAGG